MKDELTAEVRSLVGVLAGLDLAEPERARSVIEERAPVSGPLVARIHELLLAGIEAGWLLQGERGGIRFGRLSRNLDGFSVDVVLSAGPVPRHRHPKGEVDLLLAGSGTPRFDGHGEGWAVYPPGSTHVPEVEGGEMLILYFLPSGSIEFLDES